MHIRISDKYHRLRVRELELTADYLAKQEEEKERRRELREQQREEECLQRELERERSRLDKERQHYQSALERLRSSGSDDVSGAAELQDKLAEIEASLAAVDAREANIRAGYVYVISNIGAFGERVVKIGLTRRLEPMDRVNELGDASVPFRFDVHALIFSEDAVGLERKLHEEFEDRRVNRVNLRREFFYIRPPKFVKHCSASQDSTCSSSERTPKHRNGEPAARQRSQAPPLSRLRGAAERALDAGAPAAAQLAAQRRTDADIALLRATVDKPLPVTRQWDEQALTGCCL